MKHAFNLTAIALFLVLSNCVSGQENTKHITAFDVNSMLEIQERRDLEFVHTVAEKVKENENLTVPERSGLMTNIGRLVERKVLGLNAAQRQALVKEVIGQAAYSALEQYLVTQLDASNISEQQGAMDLLGYTLFALDASDSIKTFVFSSNRSVQFTALKALVCLDVPGANHLLEDMIFAGVVPDDYMISTAIKALYVSNDKNLGRVAMELLKRQPGGVTFKALLPILKKREDYREIVAQIFKSDMFYVPFSEKMSLGQKWNIKADYDLLCEIFTEPEYFMKDERIKSKVEMYANSQHNLPSRMALVICEKSGKELEFFTKIAEDNQTTPEKKKTLDLIISRIQEGRRLN